MRIAFTSTWQKTDLFALLARSLEPLGIQSCWIVTSPIYRQRLIDQGFAPESILHLKKDEALQSPTFERDVHLMYEMESRSQELVKDLVPMDRYVGSWPWHEAEKYAAFVTSRTASFLDKMDADLVMGEPSVIHDLLAVMVCQATGRNYVAPFGLRLPFQRLVFWSGFRENEFHIFGARIPAEVRHEFLNMARDAREQIVVRRIKPAYFYKNSRAPRVTPKFLFKVTRGVGRAVIQSRTDANMYSLSDILWKHKLHMRPMHYAAAKMQWSKLFEQPVAEEKFVLFTLHKQPEYSIDVQGSRFANQYQTIRALARALPADTRLYVKEHRNCLGDRSPADLKRIKAIPGVRLIDPMADATELAKDSECVVTISGTIAMEAALHGKRTLLLTDQFMAGFSTAKYIENPWELTVELRKPAPVQDLDYDMQYLGWLLENSFEGILSDPVSSPDCVSPENLELLTNAIYALTQKLSPAKVEAREAATE
jgi:hypothetical protein